MYAVVDIETTGGSAKYGRIIEIAIFITDGKSIIDHFSSLVNPEMPIPPFITSLTGIDDNMVYDAPPFHEIAHKVDELTRDKIFVAHSVNFDYAFVKNEFQLLGHTYERKKLCTVRLSRKIFPGYRTYGLGSICEALDIIIEDRHRAAGDAKATAILMNKLVKADTNGHIESSLKHNSKEAKLPANLPKEQYERLPETTGIYYFMDQKNKVIYVGKAKNLKKRVASHFTISGSGGEKENFVNKIHGLDFVETGNELVALLLESHEIKQHWPEYNRSQKMPTFNYGVYAYYDGSGYYRLALSKLKKGFKPILIFPSHQQGKEALYEMVREYALCAKLCGLQPAKNECFDHSIGKCDGACVGKVDAETYNARVTAAIEKGNEALTSFAILGKGRKYGERTVVIVDDGKYCGFGFVDQDNSIANKEDWMDRITFYKETPEIRHIIDSYMSSKIGYEIVEF